MKSKVVISVLAVIGLVALSATAAQAAGGSPFPLTSFFVCQGINGNPSGKTVAVFGNVLGTNPQQATLGNATLACAVAKLLDPKTGQEIPPNPGNLASTGLKCYNVMASRRSDAGGLPPRLDITDDLFPGGTDQNVPVSSFQYICSPAIMIGH